MIGKVIGNYKVMRKIGSGGMGEVYLAHDLSLDRDVALKFLPDQSLGNQDQLSRFLREAQAAAALNHPNIFTIYEINKSPNGHQFLVMAYYPGRNLMEHLVDGALSEETALQITWCVGEGLANAHAAGIIHRDIKPTNIMVSDEGQAVILDFGLAKMVDKSTFTDFRTTMGTAAYMSPEQAAARPVDQRTDIWSLGTVLYQMLTGRLPFHEEIPDALVYSILHNEPAPLPADCCGKKVQAILKKMLTKEPADRYQNMTQVLQDLAPLLGKTGPAPIRKAHPRRSRSLRFLVPVLIFLAAATVYLGPWNSRHQAGPAQKSVAALPFENLTGNDSLAIWSKGFPQLILAELSRSPDLYVLNQQASESVYGAMGRPATATLSAPAIRDFAQRTRIKTLILGSLLQAGDRWRIQVQLQDASTGNLLTSTSSTTDSEDQFFAAADSLAQVVRNFLEIKELGEGLSYGQRKYAAGTESAAAYRKFLEAYEAYRLREWGQAKAGFEQALDLDPEYTGVQYMLIWTYRQLGLTEKTRELFKIVQAKKSSLPVVDQYSLETMGAILDKDHWRAIQSLKKVVDRDPQLRAKWGQLGSLYLTVEEPELARRALEKAMSLTRQWGDKYPWVHLYRNLARVYVDSGLYDQAIAVAQLGLETGEQNRRSMLFWLCAANIAKGDTEETHRHLELFTEELRSKGVADVIIRMNVGLIYLKAGHTADALPQMREGVAGNPDFYAAVAWLATMLVDAGQPQEAAATLQEYLARHPEQSRAKVALAEVWIAGDLAVEEAVTCLEEIRQNEPQLADASFLATLGQGYFKMNRPELALAALEDSWEQLGQYDHETFTWIQKAKSALTAQNNIKTE